MAVVDIKKLNRIRDERPDIWEWMKHKSLWERISLGAVLINYENYIDRLIAKKDRMVIYQSRGCEVTDMTYQELKDLTDGKQLPIAGKNENGENVIVSHGKIGSRKYYKLTTAQNNGWTRYNDIYEDGDAEEYYAR